MEPPAVQHQFSVGRHREFRVAQIDILFREQRRGLPLRAVGRREDADAAVAADVPFRLAKRAPPAIMPADQIRECVVRAGVPDFPVVDEFRRDRAQRRDLTGETKDQPREKS